MGSVSCRAFFSALSLALSRLSPPPPSPSSSTPPPLSPHHRGSSSQKTGSAQRDHRLERQPLPTYAHAHRRARETEQSKLFGQPVFGARFLFSREREGGAPRANRARPPPPENPLSPPPPFARARKKCQKSRGEVIINSNRVSKHNSNSPE